MNDWLQYKTKAKLGDLDNQLESEIDKYQILANFEATKPESDAKLPALLERLDKLRKQGQKLRILEITLKVTIPYGVEVSDEYIPEHIEKFLTAGQNMATAVNNNFDYPDAEVAASLLISDIKITKPSFDPL